MRRPKIETVRHCCCRISAGFQATTDPAPLDSLQCILSTVKKIRKVNRTCIDISEIERFEFCTGAVSTFDHHRFKKENCESACQSLTPLRLAANL